MKRKNYRTKRLDIRPSKPSDYDAWVWAFANRLPKKNKWDLAPIPMKKLTRRIFKQKVERGERLAKADVLYIWGLWERKTGAHIGSIDIAPINRTMYQSANLGYAIHNRYWRKGYAKEAVKEVLRHAFRDLKLHRIEAHTDVRNKASQKLALAVGMKPEGKRRKQYLEGKKWVDSLIFAAVAEDYGIKAAKPKWHVYN